MKKLFLILISIFLLIVFWGFQKKDTYENSIFNFDANEKLFTAYAFMNAAGYDHDWLKMHPIRVEIRKKINQTLNDEFKKKIKNFYNTHNGDFSSYGEYALLLSEPPDFEVLFDTLKEENDYLKELEGLENLYREFYMKANIKELWEQYQPQIRESNYKYKPYAELALKHIVDFCRLDSEYFKNRSQNIYFTICPQMSHWTAYTTDINGKIYIINGPGDGEPGPGAFYHEALHHVINQLTEKNIELVNKYEELLEVSNENRKVGYNNWVALVNESFCRTIHMILIGKYLERPEVEILKTVKNEYKLGFILCLHIYETLPEFENSNKSLEEYYPRFFTSIDIEKEKERWHKFWENKTN